VYSGIVQESEVFSMDQEIFYINPGDTNFFGTMPIGQNSIGKVREGQTVLVKLIGYPFEEFGMIRGRIKYISEVPYKDSVFISKVALSYRNISDSNKPIRLKQGMTANAEIITQNATILQRLYRTLLKMNN